MMTNHKKTMLRVGAAIVMLLASHALVFAESTPAAVKTPATSESEAASPSKWAAPPIQTGGLVAFAALQALDVVSTLRALRQPNTYEANPTYSGVVDNPTKFIVVKAATTAATIVLMRRLSKNHPKASVLVMAGLNSAYLFAVRSNFKR